ncbi:hypothetical protein KPB05_10210 [Burkholderia gladioli]|uniref:hypothetical protein n=1 Tax=Burkholderia gladioli TaxID=28095 RepID=UPI00285635AC|nr:hypothetical protein [Burkholderia gladioli]MDR8087834.1 hypothetical protein [Burkholderia gladioli]
MTNNTTAPALTDEQILDFFSAAGVELNATPNMLYTVRGQHAQLVNAARALLTSPRAADSPRGTSAQIQLERKLTCEAIDGVLASGYQNRNPPPSDEHWLAGFWKVGRSFFSAEFALRFIRDQLNEYLVGMPLDEASKKLRDVAQSAIDDFSINPIVSIDLQAYMPECWIDRARQAAPAAPVATSIDIEQMLRDCVPGGDIVDPQLVCDNIRSWFEDHAPAAPVTDPQWLPIEIAPKDGVQILLSNGIEVQQGWWMHDEGGTTEHRDMDGRWIGQDDRDGYIGWWDVSGGMQPCPDRWMPMPPPLDPASAEPVTALVMHPLTDAVLREALDEFELVCENNHVRRLTDDEKYAAQEFALSLIHGDPSGAQAVAADGAIPTPEDVQSWAVTVEVNGMTILTISDSHVGGIDSISDFGDVVRSCAQHLTSFIGKDDAERAAVSPATATAPLNGIAATMFHGEGAIARCSYCGRYSIDPKTLGDRQPKCECGEKDGWSGSFEKPRPDAKWSGAAPATAASPAEAHELVGWFDKSLNQIRWRDGLVNADFADRQPFYTYPVGATAEAREPSPTAGMNLGERIKHVGGRENAAGYIEFGSEMAVDALIQHVLRDLPRPVPADAGEAVAKGLTDAMIDAARPLFLALECGATSIDAVRHQMKQSGVNVDLLPKWFSSDSGHLTKAGRAIIAWHLMKGAQGGKGGKA